MKALMYTGPGALEEPEIDVPRRGPGEVLLRVRAAGICGSDINGFLGRSKRRVPPLILGHEFSAEVADSPDARLPVGTRVAVFPLVGCRRVECAACGSGLPNRCADRRLMGLDLPGALADYTVAPIESCFPLPESVSDVAGALIEPLANAVHLFETAVRRHGVLRRAAIVGGGGQGLMALLVGRHLGVECHVVEPDPYRRACATRLGAAAAIDPRDTESLAKFVAGAEVDGFEVVIDTAGYAETRRLAIDLAAPGATVLYLGLHDETSVVNDLAIINREISVTGSYAYTPHDFQRALNLIASRRVDVTAFCTERSIGDAVETFQTLAHSPGELIKVVLLLGTGE